MTSGLPRAFVSIVFVVLALATPGSQGFSFRRISVSSSGVQGDGNSSVRMMTPDGRFVLFCSAANNLVPDDTWFGSDAFVHDRLTGATTRESVGATGVSFGCGDSISAAGRFVTFVANDFVDFTGGTIRQVYVRDRLLGATILVSVSDSGVRGNGLSDFAHLSADGRFVTFSSTASNLVPDDSNGRSDIFTRDVVAGRTTLESVSSTGQPGDDQSFEPSISADGRYVAFASDATNLVPDDPGGRDVFVRDRSMNRTTLESVGPDGRQLQGSVWPTISGDGRYLGFARCTSCGRFFSNVADELYFRDRLVGHTTRVAGPVYTVARVSGDGALLSFVARDVSPFIPSTVSVFSRDGRWVLPVMGGSDTGNVVGNSIAFSTFSALVADDTNGHSDVYIGVFTGVAAPGPPQRLTASRLRNGVLLYWELPVTGGPVTNFIVEVGSHPGAKDVGVFSTGTTPGVSAPDAPAGVYYVRVRAQNAAGTSAPSNEVIATAGR